MILTKVRKIKLPKTKQNLNIHKEASNHLYLVKRTSKK